MPTVDIYNIAKEKVGELDLKDEIFGVEVKGHVLHGRLPYGPEACAT